jgi:hypothetical protein
MKSNPVEYKSEGKNHARDMVLTTGVENAKKGNNGYFTFWGLGDDGFAAFAKGLRVRGIDHGYNPKHRKTLKQHEKEWSKFGFIRTTFTSYLKWAVLNGERHGTIFGDLCGYWSYAMKSFLHSVPQIMNDECDLFLTVMLRREPDFNYYKSREAYNAARDLEIVEIFRSRGVNAVIKTIYKYRNDNQGAPWMEIIHIKCTK